MTNMKQLTPAVEEMYEAALLGDGWTAALGRLAEAAEARGAMILHNRNQRLIAAACSDSILEPVRDYLAGKSPPNSRQTRVMHNDDPGFRTDQDDYDAKDIAHDPYYQDYLRPIGLTWHANARLKMHGTDEIAISFKRDTGRGRFEAADKVILDQILEPMRASVRMAEYVFDAEVRGMVNTLRGRHRLMLEFDAWGRVRRQHGRFDHPHSPLLVVRSRAIASDGRAQSILDSAIARAAKSPRRQVAIGLRNTSGGYYLFQILPVVGRARDVFLASSAVGVLIDKPMNKAIDVNPRQAVELMGMTVREVQIIELLCQGHTLTQIAGQLRIVPETVRFHLKSIFEKTGTRRQVEVVRLFGQLSL